MGGLHQNQNSAQQILIQYTVFDVVSVVFNAKRQQFEDQSQELHVSIVFFLGRVVYRIFQQGSCKRIGVSTTKQTQPC